MYKLCKTEQSAQRQQQLEEGLLQAMLIRNYDEISVSDLCQQLQIPRKSFYRYFDSKDGALQALIEHRILAFETQIMEETSNSPNRFLQDLPQFFAFWLEQKPLLDALARSNLSGLLVTHAIVFSQKEYLRDFGSKEFHHSLEFYSNVILFGVSGLMSLVIQWHHDGYRQSPEEMAKITFNLLSKPLISTP